MMEHKLQMMEQQMMDMGALHTMLRMQKDMVEMQQTMLKMQEMLKMKSKAKNHWPERSVKFVGLPRKLRKLDRALPWFLP